MTALTLHPFGHMPDGKNIDLYTLTNACGAAVSVTTYGARIVSWRRTAHGRETDIVLGYAHGADYLTDPFYMGAVVGRHANRIAGGRVTLAGHPYQLECNTGSQHQNHIHGGTHGLHAHLFTAQPVPGGVRMRTESPDGEGGYPGNFTVYVTYLLSADGALSIRYEATSDADTICNLTNHTYFNLDGAGADTIENHTAEIFADQFTWADAEALPDGRILDVVGTPMDFTVPHRIGARIDAAYDQLQMAHGYDHNWVLRGDSAPEPYTHLKKAARITSAAAGLSLSCYTTQIGIQFYTGNFLGDGTPGKGGIPAPRRGGFCLETQYFPNAPAHPSFPQPILQKGRIWTAETVYLLEDL